MRVNGVTANLSVPDIAGARDFYADYLGFSKAGFDMGWVVSLSTPDGRSTIHLVTHDATAPVDSVISVSVGEDIDKAYEEAQQRGFDIVRPLTREPWGLRRFFVRAPDGNVININSHPA